MAYKGLTKAILATGLAFAVSSAFAADAPATLAGASDAMLANTCAGCHGTNGVSTGPAAPTIAGFSSTYLEEVLLGYKTGEVPSTIMGRILKGYTEGEVKQISDFYSKLTFVNAKQSFDKAQADDAASDHEKYCEKCHAEGGTSAEDDSGILAGQWAPYLRMQMADYYAGSRTPTKKMKKKINDMHEKSGDAGVEALINYYASKQ